MNYRRPDSPTSKELNSWTRRLRARFASSDPMSGGENNASRWRGRSLTTLSYSRRAHGKPGRETSRSVIDIMLELNSDSGRCSCWYARPRGRAHRENDRLRNGEMVQDGAYFILKMRGRTVARVECAFCAFTFYHGRVAALVAIGLFRQSFRIDHLTGRTCRSRPDHRSRVVHHYRRRVSRFDAEHRRARCVVTMAVFLAAVRAWSSSRPPAATSILRKDGN